MKRILVVNQPIANRGDEAAHKALMKLLSPLEDCAITVLIENRADADDLMAYADRYDNVTYAILPKVTLRGVGFVPKMRAALPGFLFYLLFFWHPLLRLRRAFIRNADIVVCAPGGVCMGLYRNWTHIFNLQLALDLGKQVLIYGRSIGPFSNATRADRHFAKMSRRILSHVRYLSLRDPQSRSYAEALGVDCQPTIDAAFAGRPRSELPESLSEIQTTRYAVFVPNELYAWHLGYTSVPKARFDALYAAILNALELHCRVVMLPQLYGRKYSDRQYFEHLKHLRGSRHVSVLSERFSSDVQQAVIAGADLLVGARYHSIIFAINNGTPFIALSYEHKIFNTLELLGLEDYSIPLDEALSDHARVLERIPLMMSDRDRHRQRIKEAGRKARDILKAGNESFIAELKSLF